MTRSDPLVLLPGMNCSARLWAEVAARLHDVETIPTALEEPDLDGCVDHLLAALPPRFALAGLSLGGIVAMALVRRAPERVSRLCLADTNARPPTTAQHEAWEAQLRELDRGVSARELQQRLLGVLLHPAAAPSLVEQTLLMADETGGTALAAQLRLQQSRIDERPALSRITVPTLVIAGADDALCPPERHQEIAAAIPGADLTLLPDTGHLAPLERPEQVADSLRAWLAR